MDSNNFVAYLSIFVILIIIIIVIQWGEDENKYGWYLPIWLTAPVIAGMVTSIFGLLYEGLYIWLLLPIFSFIGLSIFNEKERNEFLSLKEEKYRSERIRLQKKRLVEAQKMREEEARREKEQEELKIENEASSKQRKSIPQKVKDQVWNRDDGKCVQCGSKENLEFDHIIPHSKGGANTYRNLQLLCEPCNRSKSNKIG
jgi:uncharacterized membrane protein